MKRRVCVIDGQGGGIGETLIKYFKKAYGEKIDCFRDKCHCHSANDEVRSEPGGVSGENAIVQTVAKADLIVGPISITWANAMLGEVTPRMAEAITSSPAPKILLPLIQERVVLVGVVTEPLPHLVQVLVEQKIKEVLKDV